MEKVPSCSYHIFVSSPTGVPQKLNDRNTKAFSNTYCDYLSGHLSALGDYWAYSRMYMKEI